MCARRSNPQARMGILAHIREARKRLIYSLLGVGVGAIAGWNLYDPVMEFIQRPLLESGTNAVLNFPTVGSAFDLKLRVSLWLGMLLSAPWWIAQVSIFVAPALKRKEKLYVVAFSLVGALLFACGAGIGIWMAPRAVEILQSFVPSGSATFLQANAYVSFYMHLVLAFGLSFLTPEILVLLNFLGILSARTMLRGWRWATVVAFVFAAVANPLPSPWPMVIQAFVLLALYLIAVGISWIHDRRQ